MLTGLLYRLCYQVQDAGVQASRTISKPHEVGSAAIANWTSVMVRAVLFWASRRHWLSDRRHSRAGRHVHSARGRGLHPLASHLGDGMLRKQRLNEQTQFICTCTQYNREPILCPILKQGCLHPCQTDNKHVRAHICAPLAQPLPTKYLTRRSLFHMGTHCRRCGVSSRPA